ncbi:MAG: N-acetylmuramoyl-L-alanine amidase [Armatimonadota bacterium]|nr:N-acetylmuramoyl-L-alanine amidase [Armatimonadota bacterium]
MDNRIFIRVRPLRQGISKATVLLLTILALLTASQAFAAAPSGATIVIGSRQVKIGASPAAIDGAIYVPLEVVSALGASYVSQQGGRTITIKRADGQSIDLPVTQHKGSTLVPLVELTKAVGVAARWEPATRTLRLIPQITNVEYANGNLYIRSNYPIRFTSRLFEGLNVFAIDVSPAKIDGQTKEVRIWDGDAIRARVGQFSPEVVRIAVDLTKPVALVPAIGKKTNEIIIPISRKPVVVKPPVIPVKPGTQPSTLPATGQQAVEVKGVKFQSVDNEKCKVIVATTGRVITQARMLQDPLRLFVDIQSARLAKDVIPETATGHPVVQSVRVGQFQENPDIVRVVLDLTRQTTFSIMQTANSEVIIDVGGIAAQPGFKGATIVVDPGHGGSQTGAISPDGSYYEKNLNLAIARRLSDLLQSAGAYAIMTRYSDTAVGLVDRPRLASDMGADMFVSLHCNSIGVPDKTSGIETYYHMKDEVCRGLATTVQKAVVQATGMKDNGFRSDSVIWPRSGFSVLRNATVPAILVEMGYLDSSSDLKKLVSPEYQQKLAQGVFEGIKAFLEGERVVSINENIEVSPY